VTEPLELLWGCRRTIMSKVSSACMKKVVGVGSAPNQMVGTAQLLYPDHIR